MTSKTMQEKTLDEGLALGAAMLGLSEVEWKLIETEGAFRRAWVVWPFRELFPSLRFDLARNELRRILNMSPRRRGARVSGWTRETGYVPWVDGDDWESMADVISDEIPASAWLDLARQWLNP